MSFDPVPISLYAGINRGVSEDSLEDGQVQGASNFLFRRRESILRPGLKKIALSGSVAGCIYARSLLEIGQTSFSIYLTGNKVLSIDSSGNVVDRTGGTGALFTTAFANATAVNGIFLVGNNASGGNDFYWDPTIANGSLIGGDGRWRYVTSHTARGVGAFRTSGAANDPISVGWSDQGNPLNWATGGASTAGSAVLSDMTEDITGAFTIRNIIVIPRHTGFHLGYPTGISFPPFRFEPWNRDGVGVFYPETADVSNNVLYFVGEDDVYTFDLQRIQPIGTRIRDDLLPILRSGVIYRGFIARGTFGEARATYNLAPAAASDNKYPHFVYDINEDTWSRCDYDDALLMHCPFYRYPISSGGVSFLGDDGFLRIWDNETACETRAHLEAPTKFVGPLSKDMRCGGVLLKHRNFNESMAVKVTVNGQLFASEIEASERRTLGEDAGDRRWARTWFRSNIVGQGFTTRIDIDPGQRFSTNYLELYIQEAGEYRGRFV